MATKLSSTPFDRVEQTTQDITFYVETTGDDDAPGTAAAPLATLQEAFDGDINTDTTYLTFARRID